jgi:hypothetical protein
MKTSAGHLSYCTNIHAGKNWKEDFENLKQHFPIIKAAVAENMAMGIGLRLSNNASLELMDPLELARFKTWLKDNDAYVFTMNGFPYGDFHHTVVKAEVHSPDWTSLDRKVYTLRLIDLLAELLPADVEGGISTSPLSYRRWFEVPAALDQAVREATLNIIEVICYLATVNQRTGKVIHLDLEPEPDGVIESGSEYIAWYESHLLPLGIPVLAAAFALSDVDAELLIKKHLCLCYDVCHFSIGFENHEQVLAELSEKGLNVGKIQISAALKAQLTSGASRQQIKGNFKVFDEPTYLHQVVARGNNGKLGRFPDLTEALETFEQEEFNEWRAHFHVPVSVSEIGFLQSTQADILEVLAIQEKRPFCSHMEVETYTWEVLPEGLKLPITESIINELKWVLQHAIK